MLLFKYITSAWCFNTIIMLLLFISRIFFIDFDFFAEIDGDLNQILFKVKAFCLYLNIFCTFFHALDKVRPKNPK